METKNYMNFAKRLVMILAVVMMAGNMWGADEVYKTATLTGANFSASTQGYTDNSFSCTTNSFRVDITNANNNQKGWSYIKMGDKNSTVVGTITTYAAIDQAITKVDLTIDAITADNINSITLYTKTSTSSWSSAGTFTKSTGVKSVTLSSPAANLFYKIEVSCKTGKGSIQLSKVEYYKAGTVTCTTPPTVTAGSNSSVTENSATVSCASGISSLGSAGCSITSYGFVIGSYDEPTIYSPNTKHQVGTTYTTTGTSFSKNLTGLTAGTTYYVRPYATNGNGTAYGTVTSFTTLNKYYLLLTDGTEMGEAYILENATALTDIDAPLKTGNHIEGYYTDENCTNKIANNEGALIANVEVASEAWTDGNGKWIHEDEETLYIKWEANTHKFAWNFNGGSSNLTAGTDYTAADNNKAYGSGITYPTSASMSKTGYTFDNWSSSATTMPDADLTISASWNPISYDITYKDQGDVDFTGTQAGAPTKHTYGTATALMIPTKEGYTFAGWFTASNCESGAVGDATSATLAADGYTADITLYAKWILNSYSVQFDKNGGTGDDMSNQAFDYGEEKSLSANTYTAPAHHYFLGWNTNKNATTATYTNEQSVSNLSLENGVTVTLYAIWTEHTYTNYRTVCCNAWDDPEIAYGSYSLAVNGTADITITGTTHGTVSYESSNTDVLTVANDGKVTAVGAGVAHVIVSWTAADGYCEKEVSSADITVTGNVTVTFDANGGSSTMEPQSIPVNTQTALNANAFTAPNCKRFAHWNTESDDSGETSYNDEAEVTITEGMTLYAIWETIPYTVTKGDNTGAATFNLSPASTVDCGGTITITCAADGEHSSNPTITATDGTYTAINVLSATSAEITGVSGDITVNISYAAKPVYNITWKVGGVALTGDALTGVTTSVVEGNGLTTLPSVADNAVGTGLKFMGWKAGSELTGLGNSAPSDLFTAAGSEPTIADNVTYHAVFAKQTAEASDSWDLCETVNSVTAGDYVITWDNTYYLPSETAVNKDPDAASGITVNTNEDALTNTVTSEMQWSLAGNNTDGFTIRHKKNTTTYRLGAVDVAEGIKITTSDENSVTYLWTVDIDATDGMRLHSAGTTRYLAVKGTDDWRYYAPANYSGTMRLYKHNVVEAAYADYITKVVALSSIAITTAPDKTAYKKGDVLDLTNMVVTATYADASTHAVTGYTVDLAETALATSNNEFEVSYTEGAVTKTTTQAINVYALSGIAITNAPMKTVYKKGELVNTTGMAVQATWGGDATDKIVENNISGWTIDLDEELLTTNTKFVVSYTHEGVTETADQAITVFELNRIDVTTAPAKTTYQEGDSFDKAGMAVKATWGSGENKIEATLDAADYTITPSTFNSTEITSVTISYTHEGVEKTTTQAVTVTEKPSKIMTWNVANEDPFTTKIYVNAQSKYILAFPDAPDPEDVGFTSAYVFKGWTTASSVAKSGVGIAYAEEGAEMEGNETFYAVFAEESEGESAIFTETFNSCSGSGGNDGEWNGQIASNNVVADNNGWSITNGNGADRCIKLGTGKNGGSAQTPSFTLNSATATITFKAGAWDANGEGTSLSVATSAGTLKSGSTTVSSVTIKKGEWDNFTLTLIGVTNSAQITFSTSSGNKRFFLDEVVVTTTVTTYSNYRLAPSAVKTPQIGLAAGTYYGAQTVTLSQEDSKPIYYTLDGTAPTTSSTLYASAINLNEAGTKTLKAVAYDAGVDDYSLEASAAYTIVTEIDAPTLPAATTFYDASKSVEISHALTAEGAEIHYSYDDVTYNTYNEALEITETKTVYAYATIGSLTSEKVSATYTKGETVTYKKITTDAELAMGMQFIIAATTSSTESDAGAGLRSGTNSYLSKVDVPEPNAQGEIDITSQAVSVFTLDGMPGAYTMLSQQGKLSCSSATGIGIDGTFDKWTIAFAAGVPKIKNTYYTTNELMYNASSPRFTMYGGTQVSVALYVEPNTAYTLTFDVDGTANDKAFKVVAGYEYTISNTTYGNTPGDGYEFANKWTDGTNFYKVGDKITLSNDVTLTPCWKLTQTEDVDIDGLPEGVTEIVVKDGKDLNVNDAKTLDNLTVEAGGTVSGTANLTVNDFTIEASQVDSKSGQVTGTGALNVTGEAYFDLKVAEAGGVTAGWYTFAVPFEVDALNGVYYGDTKLTNEVNYAIMAYDGEVRATGKYGWKKYRGILQPGTMYTITLGNTDYNVLRFRKAEGSVVAENKVALHKYPLKGGNTGDNGWNAVANPNLYYSSCSMSVAEKVQYYDHESNTFSPDNAADITYIVGSCFFVQANNDGTMTMDYDATPGTLKAPQREAVATEEFKVRLGKTTEDYVDQLFVSASEDATDTYQTGHDLRKSTIDSKGAKVAQMTVNGYGMSLCDAEFPLVNNTAIFPLTLTSPKAEAYTLYIARQPENATLYLMQNGSIIWNLTTSPFVIDLPQGSETSYSLMLVNAAQTPTDVETVSGERLEVSGVQKIILNEHVYILRDGKMYDAAGAVVR